MNEKGLIYAYLLDGEGGAQQLSWGEISKWQASQGTLWLHFDYSAQEACAWILKESGLDDVAAEALITEETRPRTTIINDGVLLALRGVNLAPGADPEDMVSVRGWITKERIITTRKRKLMSVSDIATSLTMHKGPKNAADFLVALTENLIARMEGTIESIEDRVAEAEEQILTSESVALRSSLSSIRRESIMLRRYLAPQREAMIKLNGEKVSWVMEEDRLRLRETTDQLIRYIEDLDSVRDRAAVTQEELVNRMSEQMNLRMYVLSLVAAIFLPLGFLTGLLGINVGGIPGAENKSAFIIFILILLGTVVFQVLLFKRKKWM